MRLSQRPSASGIGWVGGEAMPVHRVLREPPVTLTFQAEAPVGTAHALFQGSALTPLPQRGWDLATECRSPGDRPPEVLSPPCDLFPV